MAAKVKSLAAAFKLSSSERFCEDVSGLILRGNELNLDDVFFNFLPSKVEVDFEKLGPLMKHWIVTELDAALIVAIEMSRLVVKTF